MNEVEKHTDGWTLKTLFKHFTQRLVDFDEAFKVFRDTVNRDAVKQNEFRKSLDDLGQKMQTKLEAQALQKSNDDKFEGLTEDVKQLRSRLDVGNPAVATLQNQQATDAGIKRGSDDTWKVIVTIITVGIVILGFIGFNFK